MSAHQWKIRLHETQEELASVVRSLTEWKLVAENRKTLLLMTHEALAEQLKGLAAVGTIFGCDPDVPESLVIPPLGGSGATITESIRAQIFSVASFVKSLTEEAGNLQLTLNDTLGLASKALLPDRPEEDLTIPNFSPSLHDSSSPLREVAMIYNGQGGTQSSRASSVAAPLVKHRPEGYSLTRDATDDLFTM